MRMLLTATLTGLCLTVPAFADGHQKMEHSGSITYKFDGAFDDATFAVESAIVGAGLKIDYTSHVGEMLARTAADVGSDVTLFDNADIFVFCSAVVSRRVMEADPTNLAFCPYGIFVSDRDGQVEVGYRKYPDGPMQEVQALLDSIVREAVAE
ncbi:DUF302 domain-containing protein [Aliiroseovarius crassostreae]|nr:DUF302 domain-containing protein [Aliiroseovarius crassostreae]